MFVVPVVGAVGSTSSLWLWYLTRSTGVVATVLAVASLVWGLRFSSRQTGTRLKAAWWLDLHKWLGGSALVFTIAHVAAVLVDSTSGFSFANALIPGSVQQDTMPIAYGILGLYGLALAVLTSWPKMLFPRKVWLLLHLLSLPATFLAGVHAYQAGSDQGTKWLQASLVVMLGLSVYAIVIRLFNRRPRRPGKSAGTAVTP